MQKLWQRHCHNWKELRNLQKTKNLQIVQSSIAQFGHTPLHLPKVLALTIDPQHRHPIVQGGQSGGSTFRFEPQYVAHDGSVVQRAVAGGWRNTAQHCGVLQICGRK